MRVALWLGMIFVVAEALSARDPSMRAYPLSVVGVLIGSYLALTTHHAASKMRIFARQQPLLTALVALLVLFPLLPLLPERPWVPELGEALLAGMLLFLPTACALLNASPPRQGDRTLALGAIALPTLLAFSQDVPQQPLSAVEILARAMVLLVVVALGWLVPSELRARLNFLWASAALALWAAWAFDAFPELMLDPAVPLPFFWLAALPLLALIAGVGNKQSAQLVASAGRKADHWFGIAASVLVGVGLLDLLFFRTLDLRPSEALVASAPALSWLMLSPNPILQTALVFLLLTLPEEIVARAVWLTELRTALGWSAPLAGAASGFLFGVLNLALLPLSWGTLLFAVIRHVVGVTTFLKTRSVFVSAGVSAVVVVVAAWLLG